jgi:hypothetical protein
MDPISISGVWTFTPTVYRDYMAISWSGSEPGAVRVAPGTGLRPRMPAASASCQGTSGVSTSRAFLPGGRSTYVSVVRSLTRLLTSGLAPPVAALRGGVPG